MHALSIHPILMGDMGKLMNKNTQTTLSPQIVKMKGIQLFTMLLFLKYYQLLKSSSFKGEWIFKMRKISVAEGKRNVRSKRKKGRKGSYNVEEGRKNEGN